MKRILLTIAFLVPLLLIFHVAFRKPHSASHATSQDHQRFWLASKPLTIPSTEMTNALKELVGTRHELVGNQEESLLAMLQAWMHMLHSGTYEDFTAFRKPDWFEFDPDVLDYLSQARSIDKAALTGLSDEDKARLLFALFTRITFNSVYSASLELKITSTPEPSFPMNPFLYYSEGVIKLRESSPCRFTNSPANAVRMKKSVEWAIFSAAYGSAQRQSKDAIPIQLVFYWSPAQDAWVPYQCFLTSMPAEGGKKTPMIFF